MLLLLLLLLLHEQNRSRPDRLAVAPLVAVLEAPPAPAPSVSAAGGRSGDSQVGDEVDELAYLRACTTDLLHHLMRAGEAAATQIRSQFSSFDKLQALFPDLVRQAGRAARIRPDARLARRRC